MDNLRITRDSIVIIATTNAANVVAAGAAGVDAVDVAVIVSAAAAIAVADADAIATKVTATMVIVVG